MTIRHHVYYSSLGNDGIGITSVPFWRAAWTSITWMAFCATGHRFGYRFWADALEREETNATHTVEIPATPEQIQAFADAAGFKDFEYRPNGVEL